MSDLRRMAAELLIIAAVLAGLSGIALLVMSVTGTHITGDWITLRPDYVAPLDEDVTLTVAETAEDDSGWSAEKKPGEACVLSGKVASGGSGIDIRVLGREADSDQYLIEINALALSKPPYARFCDASKLFVSAHGLAVLRHAADTQLSPTDQRTTRDMAARMAKVQGR